MFVVIRSLSVAAGQEPAARQWAIDVADYLNQKFPGHNIRAYREWFGTNGRIYWTGENTSLADVEQSWRDWESDPGYINMVTQAQSFFVAGSLRDVVIEQL